MRARQYRHRLVAVLGAVGVTAAVALPVPADAASTGCRPRTVPVHATYHLIRSTISNIRPDGALLRYDENGSTTWTGDLRGSSSFTGGGTYDPATGMFVSHLHEEFNGFVHKLGVGTIGWDSDTTGLLGGPLPDALTMTVRGRTSAGEVDGQFVTTVSDPGHQDPSGGASDVVGAADGALTVCPAGPAR